MTQMTQIKKQFKNLCQSVQSADFTYAIGEVIFCTFLRVAILAIWKTRPKS